MGFDDYVCLDKEASIISNIVYNANGKKFYSNVPTVMLFASNQILTRETGLRYTGFVEGKFWFEIVDKSKFFLTKIKYGI